MSGSEPRTDGDVLVRMEAVRKRFGGVVALEDAHLAVRPGEVHALLGENGAGKSTLLGVMDGMVRADAGRITVNARTVRIRTPRDAWRLGIGVVHQHFTLVPRLSVLENLALGHRSRMRGFALPTGEYRRRAGDLMERTGLHVDLDVPVERLGVGRRQRVEILKVLLRDPRVLVLDEPTAVLAPRQVDGLLDLLGKLAREGRAVVLVAHKLDEVLRVADYVTVLRDGRTVLEAPRSHVDGRMLTEVMVGRGVEPVTRRSGSRVGVEVVARLRGVGIGRGRRGTRGVGLRNVTLEVSRGEIVGVAGVEGNGQRELARVLTGRRAVDRGVAELPSDPGFIPQDRQLEGLVGDFDLVENLALSHHRDPGYRRGPFLRWGALGRETRAAVERFGIQTSGTRARAASLSGGNQQRLVIAREMGRRPSLLVAENPTRGLDVAAEAFVHAELLELRRASPPPGIVLISTDLDEVLRLSDRIFVMVRGELWPVPPESRSRDAVGALMLSRSGTVPSP
jgi:simple sugar transport system ATP-binding protein